MGLAFMFDIAATHENFKHPHEIKILNSFQGFTRKTLQKLVDDQQVTLKGTTWSLTEKGYEEASHLYDQIHTNTESND